MLLLYQFVTNISSLTVCSSAVNVTSPAARPTPTVALYLAPLLCFGCSVGCFLVSSSLFFCCNCWTFFYLVSNSFFSLLTSAFDCCCCFSCTISFPLAVKLPFNFVTSPFSFPIFFSLFCNCCCKFATSLLSLLAFIMLFNLLLILVGSQQVRR